MLGQNKIKEIILKNKLVDEKTLAGLEKEAKKAKQKLVSYIIKKKIISEVSIYESVAKALELPFINLEKQIIRKDILFLLPEATARAHQTIIFDIKDKHLKIATLNPDDLEFFESIKKKTSQKPEIHLCTPSSIKQTLDQYHKNLKTEMDEIDEKEKAKNLDGKKLKKLSSDLPIVRIVDTLLEQAFYDDASDIHIEPAEKETTIRYRIDGILNNIMTLPKKAHQALVARIKVLSNLKIDEHRLPQDGRFNITSKNKKIAFRVSIIPTAFGEKVVMRLLNESADVLTLEQIGLQPKPLELVSKNIKKPHGMVLVTGPTGSGKTTTLYTILNILNSSKVNISTIEDPIEYHITRVNQSQVNPKIGYTFASGLRAFLRQDPDIIMVGEIRDDETAEIAIHAALTGHLVLSTLHTNDALTTLPRLLKMKVPPFLIASTTNIIIAQRLVRRICKNCIQSYHLDGAQIEQLKKSVDLDHILRMLKRENAITDKENSFEKLLFYKGKGCKECQNRGQKGRTGIYEVLEITPGLSKLIAQSANESDLYEEAGKQKMLKIIDDGFIKAKNGITTIEEVLRVTKE